MIWVRDEQGAEYVCFDKNMEIDSLINDDEKDNCLNTSAVLGADW